VRRKRKKSRKQKETGVKTKRFRKPRPTGMEGRSVEKGEEGEPPLPLMRGIFFWGRKSPTVGVTVQESVVTVGWQWNTL